MKPDTRPPMKQRSENSDYRDVLTLALSFVGPEAGQVEWLLDRIEGKAGASGWA